MDRYPSENKQKKYYNFLPDKVSYLQRGLDYQRELYKKANLKGDFDIMVKCLENIKTEIKAKSIAHGNGAKIKKVERVINWYKTLPFKYKKKTSEGYKIKYPADLAIKINKYLNASYEILIGQLNLLGLL